MESESAVRGERKKSKGDIQEKRRENVTFRVTNAEQADATDRRPSSR
jgi:hypothetical protein